MNTTWKQSSTEILNLKPDIGNIPEMESIEIALYGILSDSTGAIRDMCRHMLDAGGKRVRPLLVLYSGLLFTRGVKELMNAAAAAELIHMASLVHDDIIDHSSLRRNRASVNEKWGNHYAVLCGDYLFAKAFGTLSENRLIRSMDFMVEAIENMCNAEILQAEIRFDYSIKLEVYYELIAKKTAIFLACCCKSGAAAAGVGEAQIHALGEYGLNLGYAFQIVDDMLDLFGDISSMGKPKFEDLRQGCVTMPIILLLKDERYAAWVGDIIAEKVFTVQAMGRITEALIESGIAAKVYNTAASHISKAKDSLALLPESVYLNGLHSLADMVGSRIS